MISNLTEAVKTEKNWTSPDLTQTESHIDFVNHERAQLGLLSIVKITKQNKRC